MKTLKPRAAVGMGIPMGIPMVIPVGMGWVWGLKCHPHGSPAKTIKIALFISLVLHKDQFNASENAAMPTDANMLRFLSSDEIVRITNIFFLFLNLYFMTFV